MVVVCGLSILEVMSEVAVVGVIPPARSASTATNTDTGREIAHDPETRANAMSATAPATVPAIVLTEVVGRLVVEGVVADPHIEEEVVADLHTEEEVEVVPPIEEEAEADPLVGDAAEAEALPPMVETEALFVIEALVDEKEV
jgi:hypothetical protein